MTEPNTTLASRVSKMENTIRQGLFKINIFKTGNDSFFWKIMSPFITLQKVGLQRIDALANAINPNTAVGPNLDNLALMTFTTRLRFDPPTIQQRFYVGTTIGELNQNTALVVPRGTLVFDADHRVVYETIADLVLEPADAEGTVEVRLKNKAGTLPAGFIVRGNTLVRHNLQNWVKTNNLTEGSVDVRLESDKSLQNRMATSFMRNTACNSVAVASSLREQEPISDVRLQSLNKGNGSFHAQMTPKRGTLSASEILTIQNRLQLFIGALGMNMSTSVLTPREISFLIDIIEGPAGKATTRTALIQYLNDLLRGATLRAETMEEILLAQVGTTTEIVLIENDKRSRVIKLGDNEILTIGSIEVF